MTVVFEDTYQVFQDQNKAQQIAALPDGRDRYGVMIHSVPSTMSQADLTRFARQVLAVSRSVFLASLDTGFYDSFSSIWTPSVKFQSSMNGSVSYNWISYYRLARCFVYDHRCIPILELDLCLFEHRGDLVLELIIYSSLR